MRKRPKYEFGHRKMLHRFNGIHLYIKYIRMYLEYKRKKIIKKKKETFPEFDRDKWNISLQLYGWML